MRKRPLPPSSRLILILSTILLPLLILAQTPHVLSLADSSPPQEIAGACTRFSLAQGRNKETGAGVNGRYQMIEVHTGRTLAAWDAQSRETVSDWIEGLPAHFQNGVWVEVFFTPSGQNSAVPLRIINHAPYTAYGWIAPGQCHAIEIEFPAEWLPNQQLPNPHLIGGGMPPPSNPVEEPPTEIPPETNEPTEETKNMADISFTGTGQSIGNAVTNDAALGDLDGDGDLDAFAANDKANKVWLNNGNGFFLENGQSLGNANSRGVALGDLDGDGDLDAFLANDKSLQVWVNDKGQFSAGQMMTSTGSTDVALGDLDNDGYLDAVIAVNGRNQVWLNKSARETQIAFEKHPLSDDWWKASTSRGAALADMNQDGCLDVIFVPDGIWLNSQAAGKCSGNLTRTGQITTSGYFQGLIPGSEIPKDNNLDFAKLQVEIAVGNIDGDPAGTMDIAVSNQDVFFFSNDGQSGLSYTDNINMNEPNNHFGMALGDLDNDGDLDIFTTQAGSSRNYIFRNMGSFNFRRVGQYAANFSQAVALGDLNGDGLLDAFVAGGRDSVKYSNKNTPNQVLLNSSPSLLFQPIQPCSGENNCDFATESSNLTGDSVPDRLEVEKCSSKRPGCPAAIKIFTQAAASESTPAEEPTQIITTRATRNAVLGDLDGDNDLDIYAANYWNEPNQIFLNDGQGNFSDSGLALGRFSSMDAALADLDSDGDLDLLETNYNSGVAVWWNHGNLRFQRLLIKDHPEDVIKLDVADVNGDGQHDVLVTGDKTVSLLLNQGAGIFQTIIIDYPPPAIPISSLKDMAGDGDIDTHIEVEYRHTVKPGDSNWHDVDNDGDVDILIIRDEYFSLLLNQGNHSYKELTGKYKFPVKLPVKPMGFDIDNDKDNDYWITIGRPPVPQEDSRLQDVDQDGDNDILIRDEKGTWWYENNFQGEQTQLDNKPSLTIGSPSLPNAPSLSVNQVITCSVIPIPYNVTEAYNTPAYIQAEYSFNGGGQWFTAQEAVSTTLKDLAELPANDICHITEADIQDNVFYWDTFASGFYGQSNNVVMRFTAQAQPIQAEITGTVKYINQAAGPYQTTPSVATSPVFRVRGTQIQVFHETSGSPAPGAAAYLLREGSPTAQLMANPATNRALVTDQAGYLNGRGTLQLEDKLFAMLPVSQTYRIPPQLIFSGSGSALIDLTRAPITNSLTAEFWLYPQSETGTLFSLGDQLDLSYARITETTAVTLTIAGQTLTHNFPLHNGTAHHLAFSWDGREAALIIDGEEAETAVFPNPPILANAPLRLGQGYTGAMDEIRLWQSVRSSEQISETLFTPLGGSEPGLVGYWPIADTDQDSAANHSDNLWCAKANNRGSPAQPKPSCSTENSVHEDWVMTFNGDTAVAYKPLYTFYHTSGAIPADTDRTNTVNTVNGVQFQPVAEPGVQPLIVSAKHPLILFDLDVSLEWDARNDANFLRDLQDSFRDASALLYDVSNGQIALGQINLFHDKAYWGTADIVIFADNSLRPSAAIGGVVNTPVSETVKVSANSITASKTISEAYLPGQIRMGTSWDPYGETTADLGVEWSRALAHELAHYLLFLPDNYLGIENDRLRRVSCPGSFMTTTSDPSYSEFLSQDNANWKKCQNTLAARTTGRSDWQTIAEFYPLLNTPTADAIIGPSDLPLAVTTILPWAFTGQEPPFPARNFDIRSNDGAQERLRLPNGQAYLIKTQGTLTSTEKDDLSYLTDDQLIILGSPTGGGDRLDVRGASENDILCLFDNTQNYSGCIDQITRNTVAVPAAPIWPALAWQPEIVAHALDATTVAITVTQPLTAGDQLLVQLFPLHYGSIAGNAPVKSFAFVEQSLTHTAVFTMLLPAYETAVRIWTAPNPKCEEAVEAGKTCRRESVTTLRLNPTEWEAAVNLNIPPRDVSLEYTPVTFGPDSSLVGGPDSSLVGGPDSSLVGGPDSSLVGGPDSSLVGGAGRVLLGNPDSSLVGGALILGHPDSSLVGGPDSSLVGGPDSSLVGGAGRVLLGNPDSSLVGGAEFIGNPDSSLVGGGNRVAAAPILSADAQVIIYNTESLFAENGVESIQTLAAVPFGEDHPWLFPVGQAYEVKLADTNLDRFISFTYLQQDVPEGYEHTLTVYFLPENGSEWQPAKESERFVENLIVAKLEAQNGTYAIMSTIPLPALRGGEWNLLPYPVPDCRPWADDPLASLADRVDGLRLAENISPVPPANAAPEATNDLEISVDRLEPGRIYWIHITPGENITPYLAPPIREPDGEFIGCNTP